MNYLEKRFIPKTETLIFPFDEKHLIIPVPESQVNFHQVFTVNDTGLELWHQLSQGKSPAEILRYWSKKYSVHESELLDSVIFFLKTLKPLLDVRKEESNN
ncbi:MAG: PqqD family protein [Bacteroidales bacterium]|nr:PqqD family protein [Bacteroidales bacterium]